MTPEERRRAGGAVAERIAELGMTIPEVARKAGLDPTTVRSFIRGRQWPRDETRARLAAALDWEIGDVARRALAGHVPLNDVPNGVLLDEVCRRHEAGLM